MIKRVNPGPTPTQRRQEEARSDATPADSKESAVPCDSLDSEGSASRLMRYAGNLPLPVVGSGLQTIYGLSEIRAAKSTNARNNGIVDATSGGVGVLNDASTITFYASSVFQIPQAVLGVAGPICGVTGMMGGLMDGGRDIYNGIEHHKGSEAAIGAVKIAASAASGAAAIMGCLPLTVALSLIYTGAIVYQNRESVENALRQAEHKLKDLGGRILHPHSTG